MQSSQRQFRNPAPRDGSSDVRVPRRGDEPGCQNGTRAREPMPECVDLHEMSPTSLITFATQAVGEVIRVG
jgi:hypothetical protein